MIQKTSTFFDLIGVLCAKQAIVLAHLDVDRVLEAVDASTKLVFVCSPIQHIIETLPAVETHGGVGVRVPDPTLARLKGLHRRGAKRLRQAIAFTGEAR